MDMIVDELAAEPIANRYDLLRRLPKGGVVAEIGVFAGDFAAKILEIVRPQRLVLVDWWKPGPVAQGNVRTTGPENYRRVLDRFAAPIATGQVVVVRQEASDAAQQFEDEFLDWVYIDADHNYAGVARDLAAWRTKVKRTGLILGHDYCELADRDYGVVRAVNDAIARRELELVRVTLEAFPSFIARRAK
ncbi:MAG: class I SAM-dependent methyltransferase [Planctomycetes bacterium]|nr:class I SAM-dependent methyltransferase [Planctomycetota bacterium]